VTGSLILNRLKDKKVAIVGGGSGMGASLARALADQGAQVAIGGRRLASLEETAQGTTIQFCSVDVAEREQTLEFFHWVDETLGALDILVNAAGTNIKKRSMAEMPPEDWDRLMAINATGAYNCMLAVLPGMRDRRSGTIMNISSVAGKRAIALGGVAYSASKFAMTALGTCVSNEVAPEGIRVVNVYPGEVNTPILDNRPTPVSAEHRQSILQPEQVTELLIAVLNLPENVHVPELVIKPLGQAWN
jgi:NADP-dependent 3-hydroxy acid dehydrogenase YdfG